MEPLTAAPSLGHLLPVWSVTPFALMLVGIAVIPLAWPHFWEPNRNKALVSSALGIPVALYVGRHDAAIVGHTALEYVSFIVLLGALFPSRRRSSPRSRAAPSSWGRLLPGDERDYAGRLSPGAVSGRTTVRASSRSSGSTRGACVESRSTAAKPAASSLPGTSTAFGTGSRALRRPAIP